ncbi:MAG TPA: FHA domain-containing protein [Streptosporangiaceae bacterium]|nr:FHA domain-containing protein [Streptosporangiaceae bacterium]
MATCPDGHESTATDFCDICGMRIEGAASNAAASAPAAPAHPGQAAAAASGPARETCPNCGVERTGQFCERCGLDFSSGTVPPSGPPVATSLSPDQAAEEPQSSSAASGPSWSAIATADRDYFDQVVANGGPDAATIEFPDYCPERRFRLSGPQMRIGRRSASRGIEPEIDLTGPPADTGVSHLHAVLTAEPDGTWALVDPGSANGTQLNGADIAAGVKVPLHDGDRISLGGWTVLTIHAS